MATVKAKDRETEARERFDVDVAEHKMTVLRDEGLYRHLRFQKPGTSCYYFDLVTWPGHHGSVRRRRSCGTNSPGSCSRRTAG